MHQKILITHVEDITAPRSTLYPFNSKKLHMASLAFVIDKTKHFRCIKNRWESPNKNEYIPLSFLLAYIMRYEQYFTKEDLVASLIYETTC